MKVNFFTPSGAVVEVYRGSTYIINMAITPQGADFRIYERDEDEVCLLNVTSQFPVIEDFEDLSHVISVMEMEQDPQFRQMADRVLDNA